MKEKIYKYSLITFIIINFVTLYLFYDYLTEKPTMFQAIGLFFDFVRLIIFSLGLAIILLLIRLYFHITKKKNYLKTNFLYVFSAIFSVNSLLNSVICIYLGLVAPEMEWILIVFGLLISSIFTLIDIYRSNFTENF